MKSEGRLMKCVKNWSYVLAAAVGFAGFAALHSATHRAAPPAPESQIVCAADSADLALRDRIAAKQAVADDLIARRTSLFEAAAAFQALSANGPEDEVQIAYPQAASADEAYCRSVIDYVAAAPGGQNQALVAELQAELNEQFPGETTPLGDGPTDPAACEAPPSVQ
jgi:hypothetical protein